jgi:hypothetical protein
VPIVLVVSDIRMRGGATGATAANTSASSKPGQQQQQQQPQPPAGRPAAAAAAAADAEVLGMQLSDGWYYVNTIIDGPITDLILNGRLQVGGCVRGVLVVCWFGLGDTHSKVCCASLRLPSLS